MTATDKIIDAKMKISVELQALQRRLALLEEFEKQGYNTRTCEAGYHDWEDLPWEDGYVGLRYEGYGNDVVKDLHICVNCGVMRTTKFSRLLTDMEDPFKALREEE
tara:strand:+ start:5942 stop:6259 length:318 start_codon:yes stop_codon:yes gene_type:complete